MNLVHGLPTGFETRGLVVTVRTGAAFWMWLSSRLAALHGRQEFDLMAQAIDGIERDGVPVDFFDLTRGETQGVFGRLVWFMRGGSDVPETMPGEAKAKERTLDYEKDIDALYAAFLQSYGVDLYENRDGEPLIKTMHWWRFLALVNNLPSGSLLVDHYMHYRGLDVSKLPRKTPADKKYVQQVIDMKRRVRLDKPERRTKRDAPYVARAKELKKAKGDGDV